MSFPWNSVSAKLNNIHFSLSWFAGCRFAHLLSDPFFIPFSPLNRAFVAHHLPSKWSALNRLPRMHILFCAKLMVIVKLAKHYNKHAFTPDFDFFLLLLLLLRLRKPHEWCTASEIERERSRRGMATGTDNCSNHIGCSLLGFSESPLRSLCAMERQCLRKLQKVFVLLWQFLCEWR